MKHLPGVGALEMSRIDCHRGRRSDRHVEPTPHQDEERRDRDRQERSASGTPTASPPCVPPNLLHRQPPQDTHASPEVVTARNVPAITRARKISGVAVEAGEFGVAGKDAPGRSPRTPNLSRARDPRATFRIERDDATERLREATHVLRRSREPPERQQRQTQCARLLRRS